MSRFSREHPRAAFVAGTFRFLIRYAFTFGAIRRKRTANSSGEEYADLWQNRGDAYVAGEDIRAELLDGKLVSRSALEHRAFFLGYAAQVIKEKKPSSVLELGSGLGINLLALAVLCPSVREWTGIELTAEGVSKAKALAANPPFDALEKLTGKNRTDIKAALASARFTFVQGDMTTLPLNDGSFDFIFSLWALEQLPRTYPQAFAEAHRVARKHALFLEAFREAQKNLFQLIHLWRMDYFRASYREAERAGFSTERFERIPLSKIKFADGALLCAKRPRVFQEGTIENTRP